MRTLLPAALFLLYLCFSDSVSAQSDRFAYAVTDNTAEGSSWTMLRKIDLYHNTFSDVMLNGRDGGQPVYDAMSSRSLGDGKNGSGVFATGVAAIAFEKKSNRLYYTPMLINELRYIDLNTMKVFYVNTPFIAAETEKPASQSNNITRMAIAADGFGYALTNDGRHLMRFSLDKNISINDLGTIVDAQENTVSVHNGCSSFGGDMIADDNGSLFIFTARNEVFKLDIESKVATHLGRISGLPAKFTINGVAVDNKNRILVSSSMDNSALYFVDNKSWTATPAEFSGIWRTADMANSNLLITRKPGEIARLMTNINEVDDGRVQVYPNPAVNKQFTVSLNVNDGDYTIQLVDIAGRSVKQQKQAVKGGAQTATVELPVMTKAGIYLVKVIEGSDKTIYTKKIMIE